MRAHVGGWGDHAAFGFFPVNGIKCRVQTILKSILENMAAERAQGFGLVRFQLFCHGTDLITVAKVALCKGCE